MIMLVSVGSHILPKGRSWTHALVFIWRLGEMIRRGPGLLVKTRKDMACPHAQGSIETKHGRGARRGMYQIAATRSNNPDKKNGDIFSIPRASKQLSLPLMISLYC